MRVEFYCFPVADAQESAAMSGGTMGIISTSDMGFFH
jgi:hypothetical protein